MREDQSGQDWHSRAVVVTGADVDIGGETQKADGPKTWDLVLGTKNAPVEFYAAAVAAQRSLGPAGVPVEGSAAVEA